MHPARTLVVALSLPLAAQAQDPPHDRFGEPVPAPAVQRLGGPSSSQPTSHLAYSPDGKLLAASQGQGLMLWDRRGEAVTRVLIAPNAEPATRVAGLAFSPDGALLVVGTGDGALRALDPRTGGVVRTYTTFEKPVRSLAVSPRGLVAASSLAGQIRVHDLASGEQKAALQLDAGVGGPSALCFSPDGGLLVTFEGTRIGLHAFETGAWQPRWSVNAGAGDPFAFSLSTLTFSPDGQLVLGSARGRIRAWAAASGQEAWTWTPGQEDELRDFDCGFSPDGKTLAVTDGRHEVRLLDALTRAERRRLGSPARSEQLKRVAFSPDGELLAAGDDMSVFELASGACLRTSLKHLRSPTQLAFSLDGEHLASVSDEVVVLWSVERGVPLGGLQRGRDEQRGPLALSPDLGLIALGDREGVVVRRTATGELVHTLRAKHREQDQGEGGAQLGFVSDSPVPLSLAFAPDGKTLLAGYPGGAVRVWDLASGHAAAVPFQKGNFGVTEPMLVWFTKDGGLAALLDERELCMWSRKGKPAGRVPLFKGQPAGGMEVTLEETPTCTATSGDGAAFVVAYSQDLVLSTTKRPAGQRVRASEQENARLEVALSRDGKLLVSAGDRDKTVRVWRTGSKRPYHELGLEQAFGGWATALAISPDGRLLAVACQSGVYLLPLPSGSKK